MAITIIFLQIDIRNPPSLPAKKFVYKLYNGGFYFYGGGVQITSLITWQWLTMYMNIRRLPCIIIL